MPVCSICERPDAAEIVNELLLKKTGLDSIAQQTGFHRSSVHRHSQKCFPGWKAARVKSRNRKNDGVPGRLFVQWPDAKPIPASKIGPNDMLLIVQYESTPIRLLGNPRAVPFDNRTAESFVAAALAEDGERAKATAPKLNKQETAR